MHKGDYIFCRRICYILLEDPNQNSCGRRAWTAKAQRVDLYTGDRSACFLRYASHTNKLEEKLRASGGFPLSFPYMEQIYDKFIGDSEKDGRLIGIAAEYVDGQDLETYAGRDADDREMFIQMALLLQGVRCRLDGAAKGFGTFRDLRPADIMIRNEDRRPVATGLCWSLILGGKKSRELAEADPALGYADPKAYSSPRADARMDIYALGRVFCFWIMGKGYFREDELALYGNDEKLAYSFDLDRIPEKYRSGKYQPFLDIIKKMTAPPEYRYKDIRGILADMRKFLAGFYQGRGNCRRGPGSSILMAPENKEQHFVSLRWNCPEEDCAKGMPLYNYGMNDIEWGKTLVMSVYNLMGRIYYIPHDTEVKKAAGGDPCRICDKDEFSYHGKKYVFDVR